MSYKKRNNLPLPSSSNTEDLETISRNKFALLFDPKLFELRIESQRDKGNDVIVEIKEDGSYTNFRFIVQLKSTATIKPNKDNSISFPVELSNVNYLMNYGMPAYYVLYDDRSQNFFVEQVNVVFQTLIEKYSPKKLPESFKVRFNTPLNQESINDIYQSTLNHGMLLRKLSTHLKFPITQPLENGITIDSDKDVYSVEQNIQFIDQVGFELINRADFTRIIEIEQRTHPRTKASPTFNLVCGVAYFQKASLFKALELLTLAQKDSSAFEPDIQTMLTYTLIHAKYLLGMMGEDEFKSKIGDFMKTPNLGAFFQLEKAFKALAAQNSDPKKGIQIYYKTVRQILKKEKNNKKILVIAYANILDAERRILVNDLTKNFLYLSGRVDPTKTIIYEQWLPIEKEYFKRHKEVLDLAIAENDVLACTNLTLDRIKLEYAKLYLMHAFRNMDRVTFILDNSLTNEEAKTVQRLCLLFDKLSEFYTDLEHKENLVTCLFQKYELLHFANFMTEASNTIEIIRNIIQVHELNGLNVRLNKLINGGSDHEEFVAKYVERLRHIYRIAKNSGIDDEFINAPMSEYSLANLDQNIEWTIPQFFKLEFPD